MGGGTRPVEPTERCEVNFGLTLLEAEAHRELPIPAWGFGVIAFADPGHPAVRHLLDRQGPPAQLMIDS